MSLKISKIYNKPNILGITTNYNEGLIEAQKLSRKTGLPLLTSQTNDNFLLLLRVTSSHLELLENNTKNSRPIFVDFLSPSLSYQVKHGGGKNQLIAKAIGIKSNHKPSVIDTTAGFGIDSFILASLGCKVTMIERSPIIHALLEDGLKRFKKDQNSKKIQLDLLQGDAITKLSEISDLPEVVYLDPMYPERKKQILNKKNMRILHDIVGSDTDAPKLLETAIKYTQKRVVVKRPKFGGPLANLKPDLQFALGGSSRYDVYLKSNWDRLKLLS